MRSTAGTSRSSRGAPTHDDFQVEAPLGRREARIVVDRVGGRDAATGFRCVSGSGARPCSRPPHGRAAPTRSGSTSRRSGTRSLGDARYGGGGDEARRLGLDRPFLHAWRLAFTHPLTGAPLAAEDPLPPDLSEALTRARADQQP